MRLLCIDGNYPRPDLPHPKENQVYNSVNGLENFKGNDVYRLIEFPQETFAGKTMEYWWTADHFIPLGDEEPNLHEEEELVEVNKKSIYDTHYGCGPGTIRRSYGCGEW